MRPRRQPRRRKLRSSPEGRHAKDRHGIRQREEVADTKRQQATDAKNLAGEAGANELTQAEANVSAAIQGLTDATNAKPAAEKALADARAAALPLREAYDAAEKAAKEAEAVAKVASDAANKLDLEAKRATVQAVIKRKEVDAAKAALPQAQRNEQQAAAQADIAAQKLAEAERRRRQPTMPWPTPRTSRPPPAALTERPSRRPRRRRPAPNDFRECCQVPRGKEEGGG